MVERRRATIMSGDWPSPRANLVVADRESDRLIGLVTWSWESEETYWPVVGIVLYEPATWGYGLGYEALGLWSDYLFDALPAIARLDLRTWSGNRGMMRLAEKLGYTLEARFRKARLVEGAYYDGLGYGVLREEWRERYPHGFSAAGPRNQSSEFPTNLTYPSTRGAWSPSASSLRCSSWRASRRSRRW